MVITSPLEMKGDTQQIVRQLQQSNTYPLLFAKAFPGAAADTCAIRFTHIAHAIAAYLRTLAPYTSAFDRYMQGDRQALTHSQQRGFNLFMGRAQCGTCHFAPVFNGLLPPLYNRTEFEVIGVTASANLRHAVLDKDSGRYALFPVPYYQRAFKTPTVRNAAVTAPYMHNGALQTLVQVIDFYDKGGGAGLGLTVPHQTLPAKHLHLTPREKNDLLHFLEALTDKADF